MRPRNGRGKAAVKAWGLTGGTARMEMGLRCADDSQASLFGDEMIDFDTGIETRAKVAAGAERYLRNNRRVFNTLVREQGRAERAGNVLARDANEAAADAAERALAVIRTLATRRGPVSDELNRAAAISRESGHDEAVRVFVEYLTRGEGRDIIRSESASGAGRGVPGEDAARPISAEPPERDFFTEPAARREAVNEAVETADGIVARADAERAAQEPRIWRSAERGTEATEAYSDRLKSAQGFGGVDDLMTRSAVNQPKLDADIAEAARLSGAEAVVAPPKQRRRVEEKVGLRHRGKVNRLTDAVRGGVIAETPQDADRFIEALSARYRILDEGYVTTEAGYFDRKLLVVMDDGQLGEVQIWPRAMLEAKERQGHALYQTARDSKATDEARANATRQMQELYGQVRDNLDEGWRQALSNQSGSSAPRPDTRRLSSERPTSGERSSFSTSEGGTSYQSLSSTSRTNISPGARSMAGYEPSIMKNRISDTSTPDLDTADLRVKDGTTDEVPPRITDDELFDEVSRVATDEWFINKRMDFDGEELTPQQAMARVHAEDDFLYQLDLCGRNR